MRHFAAGVFQGRGAVLPAADGHTDADAAVGEVPPAAGHQPPEDPEALGEAVRELLEAFPEEAEPQEEDEDVFGHGEDLGEAAYLQGPAGQEEGAREEPPPQAKRARTAVAIQSVAMVTASLERAWKRGWLPEARCRASCWRNRGSCGTPAVLSMRACATGLAL